METLYYFAYAADLDPLRMTQRVSFWQRRQAARLEGWELVFSRRSGEHQGEAEANLSPRPGAVVEGALYTLEAPALEALDCAESVPICARRQLMEVVVQESGERVQAWVYTAPENWVAPGRPSCHNLMHLLAGKDLLSEVYYQKLCLIPACEPSEWVAVYGSLRLGRKWHFLMADSPLLGLGWTQRAYALYLADYPCVDKTEAVSPIRVEVYRIRESVLARLDELEEHPFVYVREPVPIRMDTGLELEAWVYFFPYPRGRLLPHGDYAQEYLNPSPGDMNPHEAC